MNRFTGKSIFVTGTGSGIGRAVAERLAAEGGQVMCVDISGEGASATAATIVAAGGTAESMVCDVSDEDSVAAGIAATVAAFGGLDVACNVAGIGHFAASHLETKEWFDRIIGVNLTGSWLVAKHAIPHLLATKGVIVNTASNAGKMGQPWSAAYCASKGGVVLLTKALADEYLGQLRVNAIAPGGTNTNIINSFNSLPEGGTFGQMHRMMNVNGMCEPAEIAAGFAYVASDEARFMTGSIVSIDGGLTA
jgi:NAD(P)-dependent dehydrogenase (short-subunit alcohol dehydrogenase family)